MTETPAPTPRRRRGQLFQFDDVITPEQIELTAMPNAIHAAFGYSPLEPAPHHKRDVHAHVSKLVEDRFWQDIFVERPEVRNILFQLERGQLVLISGERGTGKSTAILAAVRALRGDLGALGAVKESLVILVFNANEYSSDMRSPTQAANTLSEKVFQELEDQAVDSSEDWVAYQYEHDQAFDALRKTFKQEGFSPTTSTDWFELGQMPEFTRVREDCTVRQANATYTQRLRTLLDYIGARTSREPMVIVDNVDHLPNAVQRRCGEELFNIIASSRLRVSGAIAVRQENRDAIQRSLDTAMRSPDVSVGGLALKQEVFERPTARVTLDFIERRVAVLQEKSTINIILRSIDPAKAERLARATTAAGPATTRAITASSRSVEAFFGVLLELISVLLFNVFGAEKPVPHEDENLDFATALHAWHNGSLRDCGASLTAFAADILQNKTHTTELQPLLRLIVDTRSSPRDSRRYQMRRISRSLLYRHLMFWGGRDQLPPPNVMVFDGVEEETTPPIHFLPLRVLQYFAQRPFHRASVGAARRDLGHLKVSAARVDEVLCELAAERAPEDSGLIRIDGLDQRVEGGLSEDAVVQLLDAGRYLVRHLYVKTEYLFWSALSTPATRAAVRIRNEPTPEDFQSEVFRGTIAARFVEDYLVEKFRSEHPYMTGVTEGWDRETARRRLLVYEKLFGFGPGRWFLSECCSSMLGFMHKHERAGDFREAEERIRRVQRFGRTLDKLAAEPAASTRRVVR